MKKNLLEILRKYNYIKNAVKADQETVMNNKYANSL